MDGWNLINFDRDNRLSNFGIDQCLDVITNKGAGGIRGFTQIQRGSHPKVIGREWGGGGAHEIFVKKRDGMSFVFLLISNITMYTETNKRYINVLETCLLPSMFPPQKFSCYARSVDHQARLSISWRNYISISWILCSWDWI